MPLVSRSNQVKLKISSFTRLLFFCFPDKDYLAFSLTAIHVMERAELFLYLRDDTAWIHFFAQHRLIPLPGKTIVRPALFPRF